MNLPTGKLSYIRHEAISRYNLYLNICILLCCMNCFNNAGADEQVLWHQDFEDRLPGEMPTGWARSFGDPKFCGDAVAVSNIRSLDGMRSFLINRPLGVGYEWKQYGILTQFSPLPEGWGKLTIPFVVEGSTAHMIAFGIEIRSERNVYIASIDIRDGLISLVSGDRKKWALLGKIETGVWQRTVIWIPPTDTGAENSILGLLEKKTSDGTWTSQETIGKVPPAAAGIAKGGMLMICPGLGQGRLLYLDDLKLEQSAPPSDTELKGKL